MALLDLITGPIRNAINALVGPFNAIVNIVTKYKDGLVNLVQNGRDINDLIGQIFDEIKGFTVKPHIKSRVISLPAAQKHVKELVQVPVDIVNRLKDLWKVVEELYGKVDFEPEEVEGVSDLKAIFEKFGPKLSKVAGKVLDVVGIILAEIDAIESAESDIKGLLQDLLTLLQDVDQLNALFLSQKNPRKLIQSDDGPLRIRIGSLHQ